MRRNLELEHCANKQQAITAAYAEELAALIHEVGFVGAASSVV